MNYVYIVVSWHLTELVLADWYVLYPLYLTVTG